MRNQTPKPKTRFAAYLRCSSDDQRHGDFTTIDAQEALCRRQIEAIGGELVAVYKDEGKTGTHLRRPDYRRLLADAGARKFDGLMVSYMSRLGRGEVFYEAENALKACKVSVTLVKEKFGDDFAGRV